METILEQYPNLNVVNTGKEYCITCNEEDLEVLENLFDDIVEKDAAKFLMLIKDCRKKVNEKYIEPYYENFKKILKRLNIDEKSLIDAYDPEDSEEGDQEEDQDSTIENVISDFFVRQKTEIVFCKLIIYV